MRSYVERAKDFIAEIFPYITDWKNVYEVDNDIDVFNAEKNRKVIMRHGLSRIALITSDYVVKYDFDPNEVECIGGCEAELELYQHAVEDGFAYLFAEITPYDYDDHTFYIMPRINGIGTGNDNGYNLMSVKEKRWCEKQKLDDLHCHNYGFRNGQICIVDYAYRYNYDDDEEE